MQDEKIQSQNHELITSSDAFINSLSLTMKYEGDVKSSPDNQTLQSDCISMLLEDDK